MKCLVRCLLLAGIICAALAAVEEFEDNDFAEFENFDEGQEEEEEDDATPHAQAGGGATPMKMEDEDEEEEAIVEVIFPLSLFLFLFLLFFHLLSFPLFSFIVIVSANICIYKTIKNLFCSIRRYSVLKIYIYV